MKHLLIVICLALSFGGWAQVKNGGSAVGMGTVPTIVSQMSDVPATDRPVGLTVVCLCDSLSRYWTGTQWILTPDSARAAQMAAKYLIRFGNTTAANQIRIYDTVITNPPTASGFTVNYSHVGFTAAPTIMAIAERNTSTLSESPQISVKGRTTSSVSFNITQGNATLVTVLGLSVLQGTASVAASPLSSITIHLLAYGH